jgi:ADP-ribosylglycohydrolase
VRAIPEHLLLGPGHAAQRIATAGVEPGRDPGWRGISPFVIPSVLWALYAFLRAPGDWEGCVHTAIVVGGDVDTTAAMAGAMVGARIGAAALPQADLDRLEDRGRWRRDDLNALAELAWETRLR